MPYTYPRPSVKTLMHAFGCNRSKAELVRVIMADNRMNKMVRIEETGIVSPSHGVEYIARGHNKYSPSIYYINTGDSYGVTILRLDGGAFRVGAWAAIVERGRYD